MKHVWLKKKDKWLFIMVGNWNVHTLTQNIIFFNSYLFHYKILQLYRRKNSVGVWLEVRRSFFYRRHHRRITSVGFSFVGDSPFRRYIGRKNKKIICQWFYRRNLRAKKRFLLKIYRRIFILSMSVWNTDRIYLFINSSIIIKITIKYLQIKFIGN